MKPITDDHEVNWGSGKLFSKASGDFVGGAGPALAISRPTKTEKLYNSIKALYLRREQGSKELVFDVIKDRLGNHGLKSLPEAIDFCAEMLCQFKFDDVNNMFQESLKLRLVEVMKKVLLGDDCIPTSEAVKKYIEGGEAHGNIR